MVSSIGSKYPLIQEISSDDEINELQEQASLIDPTQTFNRLAWAVSLIFMRTLNDSRGQSRRSLKAQHGLLLIETLNGVGKIKRFIADFNPATQDFPFQLRYMRGFASLVQDNNEEFIEKIFPCPSIENINDFILPIKETWLVDPKKVENMFNAIRIEIGNADIYDRRKQSPSDLTNHHTITPYGLLGNKSIFSKQMPFYATGHPELWELAKKDPTRFKYLCQKAERRKALQKRRNLMIEAIDPFLIPEMIKEKAYSFFKVQYNPPNTLEKLRRITKNPLSMMSFVVIGSGVGVVSSIDHLWHKTEFEEDKPMIDQIDDHVRKMTYPSHNCISWALSKLEELDIRPGKNWCDYFATIPSERFVNQEE